MSGIKTKAQARLFLHSDVLILPDVLCGVIEFEAVRVCVLKAIFVDLTGYTVNGIDSHFQIPFPATVGKPYKATVDNSQNRAYAKFWGVEQKIFGDNMANGNVFYEVAPGKHLFPFSIPIKNFPISVGDPSNCQSLNYTASGRVLINYQEPVKTNSLNYYIMFNREMKYQLGIPKQFVTAPNAELDMDISLSATSVRIGDTIHLKAHLLNRSSSTASTHLRLIVEFQASVPVTLKDFKFGDVSGKGFFSKKGQNEKTFEEDILISGGLFPTSDHPSALVRYSLLFTAKAKMQYQLVCPIMISSQPPENPQILVDALNKYAVNYADRTNTFNSVFSGHFNPFPVSPLTSPIEQVSLIDQTAEHFSVDHIQRTTSLNPGVQDEQPPFPYPSWRSVVLPQGFVMFYYMNEWCFINLSNNQVSYVDPRPPEQRLPLYATDNDAYEFVVKVNAVRGIPLMEQKEPTLSFTLNDYIEVDTQKGQKQLTFKLEQGLEPHIVGSDIVLSGFTKNRMNAIVKVSQQHTFSETIYGYLDLDFLHIPSGVEITDWFQLVGDGEEAIGIGEVNVTIGVRSRVNPQLVPVCVSCVSAINKMWYPSGKLLQTAMKNEEKMGAKMRKGRALIPQFDYEVYTPFNLPPKNTYLRLIN
ncbi:hypothetical protein EIN_405570 [Entamoeba invadens IP1]|uniref:Uncharacterized protein n=1 Tax=Entamoeba invadens IP1 TaxID=370355 RepID=A0A0A1U6U0_ENTIV|nr:hypothetical protein EIN_405570 [Entamoeba invadens IP1]ELP90133.1 hypothetical protein EIN_405570 [Entamoeba invadens IP1]|eukprot:XP_004256904.1 hypothetical protein EIN_405570 [Entamoeba invadens IP1]